MSRKTGPFQYTYGPGGLLDKNSGGTRTYYGVDGRANVTVTEDDTGSKQNTYSYTAFGYILSKNEKNGPESQTFVGAQGVQLDDTSGLYYMGHRWYDPATMKRFISRDPFPADLKDPQSLNRYVYVGNNPLIYTDPTGENPFLWAVIRQLFVKYSGVWDNVTGCDTLSPECNAVLPPEQRVYGPLYGYPDTCPI